MRVRFSCQPTYMNRMIYKEVVGNFQFAQTNHICKSSSNLSAWERRVFVRMNSMEPYMLMFHLKILNWKILAKLVDKPLPNAHPGIHSYPVPPSRFKRQTSVTLHGCPRHGEIILWFPEWCGRSLGSMYGFRETHGAVKSSSESLEHIDDAVFPASILVQSIHFDKIS